MLGRSDGLKRSMLFNAGWLAGDRVVRLCGGLLVGVWVARSLGPESFGLLSYTLAFSSLFGILATLGLDGIVVREIVNGRHEKESLLGTTFRLRIAGALIGLLASVGLAALTGSSDVAIAMVALGSAAYFAQSLYVIDWYFQAKSINRLSVVAQNVGFLLSTVFKIALIISKAPVIAFAAVNLIEALVASAIMLVLYRRSSGPNAWRYEATIARDLLRESWPLILSGIAFMVYVRIDQLMIGKILGDGAVGIFAAAVRISEVWNLVPVIAVTVAFPRLLELRHADPVIYKASVQKLFSALAGISILAAVLTQVIGQWVILQLYGPAYEAAAGVLQISVWSAIFTSLGFASGRWLIAENLAKFALMRNIVGVFVNICANLVLIPALGVKGAALGTLISFIFANLLSYTVNRRLHPLFWVNIRALLLVGLLTRRPRQA